jgi:hypothetical protein
MLVNWHHTEKGYAFINLIIYYYNKYLIINLQHACLLLQAVFRMIPLKYDDNIFKHLPTIYIYTI